MEKTENEVYVQIGVTALRGPFGEFLSSVPLYIKSNQKIEKSGLTKDEEDLMHDISGIYFRKFEKELELTPQGLKRKQKAAAGSS